MSRESISLYAQTNAIRLCEKTIEHLRLEIATGHRPIIDLLVELAADQITRTGGNLATARLQRELAECQRLIAARDCAKRRAAMRVVINSTTRGES